MINANEIIARRDRLRSTRGVWESHWQEIADRVLPRQASFVTRREPGEKHVDSRTFVEHRHDDRNWRPAHAGDRSRRHRASRSQALIGSQSLSAPPQLEPRPAVQP